MSEYKSGVDPGDTVVSYTQYSMYAKCPKSWELAYGRRLRTKEPNIHLLFGTSIHNTIQEWLTKLFGGESDFGLIENFRRHMFEEFERMMEVWGETFSSPEQLTEFHDDGIKILKYLAEHADEYFSTDDYKFLGAEVPVILTPVKSRPTVKLMAYLDLVFQQIIDGTYLIRDIKTSTRGWGRYQIADDGKMAQVLIYMYYYSQLYDVPLDQIRGSYLVLSREGEYNLVQEISPLQFREYIAKTIAKFEEFIIECFEESGSPKLDKEYVAKSGSRGNNCTFCDFAKREDLCPKSKRV